MPKFVNELLSMLENYSKNDVHNACAWRIFLQWCNEKVSWRDLQSACAWKYLYNDYISAMLHVYDSDVHVHVLTILIHAYQLLCTVNVDECLNLKRSLRVELFTVILWHKSWLIGATAWPWTGERGARGEARRCSCWECVITCWEASHISQSHFIWSIAMQFSNSASMWCSL